MSLRELIMEYRSHEQREDAQTLLDDLLRQAGAARLTLSNGQRDAPEFFGIIEECEMAMYG